ncbi:uncharacterized protein (TIGR02118 family) [Pontibacter ummariensis]|uniref:EthD domain-containing protein n=1 Tax=Pontibacter ummariensis TaxID=1610492 RepID=A0A239GNP5_9BACT|nr:EthD family reductase [Pontibacter ummariensis]PRY11335.1 uncharacterized protein (TIGR02118 family) [Pontibacter ummariensis]SNS70113.1 conserved hypothetical protein [Pontibacter ummariensis]
MVRLTVLYPKSGDTRFDMDYYLQKHIPLVKEKLTPFGLVRGDLEEGLAGPAPGTAPAYHLIGSLSFNSLEELQKALAAHGEEIAADIPNYTDSKPQMQISKVLEVKEPAASA